MIALFMVAFAGPVADGAAAWDAGDLDAALTAWEPAAAGGWGSGRVKFDTGNAYYRRGDLPRAIAYWRSAGDLLPRSSAVSHNVALARSELSGVPTPAGAPWAWMRICTPGELGLLGLLMAAAGSAGLVMRRRREERFRGAFVALGVVGALTVWMGAWGWWVQRPGALAVVVDGPAVVRVTPDIEAEEQSRLLPGSELLVLDTQGHFLLVETGEYERGWVVDGAVLRVRR